MSLVTRRMDTLVVMRVAIRSSFTTVWRVTDLFLLFPHEQVSEDVLVDEVNADPTAAAQFRTRA
jgi:hypothetical protein